MKNSIIQLTKRVKRIICGVKNLILRNTSEALKPKQIWFEVTDAKIHGPSFSYDIVESAHEAICHLITTYFEEVIK
jgi:hypothetical protein